jgi:hypothetical protein
MEDISKVLLVGVYLLAGVLLFTPFEAVLEGVIAILFVAAVVLGFLLHPRKEVFYLRTTVRLSDPDGHQTLEQDYLAVKLELVRLWLLFIPTLLAVGFLVVSSGSGILWNFSLLNTIFSSKYGFIAIQVWHVPPLIVLVLLWAWISERWVLRDAEACAARSFSVTGRDGWRVRRVAYAFVDEHGECYGGYNFYFGLVHPLQLATIVLHNVKKPEVNRIAMSFLFHRLIILGHGVTDLDKQTVAAQTALAETTS